MSVLVASCSLQEQRSLYKKLCAVGAQVTIAQEGDDPVALAHQSGLVVVDYDNMADTTIALLTEVSTKNLDVAVVVLASEPSHKQLAKLLSHDAMTNLVIKDSGSRSTELMVTAQKIIKNDIFGFEKYIGWGSGSFSERVRSSKQKRPLLEKVRQYLTSIGCNKRLIRLAEGAADELLTNAIYSAPVTDSGDTKYGELPRRRPVELELNEEVTFRYACDGSQFALSVTDQFGRLDRDTVAGYLRKCLEDAEDPINYETAGAGLGIYTLYLSLNRLIINIDPGRKTEIIGILDISGNYRDFAMKPKSLNLFVSESGNLEDEVSSELSI